MLAEIITIGDEILIGQIVDTNSAWMARKLNAEGILVKQITSVSDNREHILASLNEAANRANIVLITGGLGPTKDDITKKTLATYFGVGFKRDEETLKHITQIFEKYNRPLLDINTQQANVPENCSVLLNKQGTAPGMWFEHNDIIYVSMPGVPFEMEYLMEQYVIPMLVSRFKLPSIIHHTLLIAGIGESFLAQQIEDIENRIPSSIKLAYLPSFGQIRLRLTGIGKNNSKINEQIIAIATEIKSRVAEYVIADEDIPLEKVVLDFMKERKLTLSFAESCTGGALSKLITQQPGCSSVFVGAAITYSNELKVKLLGVRKETLEKYGAVSEEVVNEMVIGAVKSYSTNYAVAVSGIAGPDGGTEDKPVGTVWIAVSSGSKTISKKFMFGNKRVQNIERASINALTMLYRLLKEHHA